MNWTKLETLLAVILDTKNQKNPALLERKNDRKKPKIIHLSFYICYLIDKHRK